MPASTFTVFNDFVEQLGKAVHNLAAHSFKAVLTNTAPTQSNAVLADITQIADGGGYTGGAGGGYQLDTPSYVETNGVGVWTFADEVITAVGGAIAAWRYVVIYNDTAANDPLVGFVDYGSVVNLADTENITLDLSASGAIQISVV